VYKNIFGFEFDSMIVPLEYICDWSLILHNFYHIRIFILYKILLIKLYLFDPRSMVCNGEEDPKSPFNW